jgi:pimeloyl-ACP methyl ester carboxylesterase
MPKFRINDGTGFEMNYEVYENILPTTSLFIHGNLSSNRWWYPSLENFKTLAQGKSYTGHMILAEIRGFGQSSSPKSTSEINVETFSEDFIALVKQHNWHNLNLVGHSTGGIISALMLAKMPQQFNKVLLLDPVGAKGFKFGNTRRNAFKLMKTNKSMVEFAIGSVVYGHDPESEFFRNVIVEDAYKSIAVGVEVFEDLNLLDVEDRIKTANIDNQVLVLHGEEDKFLSIDDSIHLSTLFKNGEFTSIPNHGHSLNLENPSQFVSLVNQFLFNMN